MSKQKYPVSVSKSTASDGSIRKGREHYSSVKLHAKLKRKRDEASDRHDVYVGLSIQARIKQAKSRRGNSQKEISRLSKLLELHKKPNA